MRGGIAKVSPSAVGKTGAAGGSAVASWLRLKELDSVPARPSARRASTKDTNSRLANGVARAKLSGCTTHPMRTGTSQQRDDLVGGLKGDGNGTDNDVDSEYGDPYTSSGRRDVDGLRSGGLRGDSVWGGTDNVENSSGSGDRGDARSTEAGGLPDAEDGGADDEVGSVGSSGGDELDIDGGGQGEPGATAVRKSASRKEPSNVCRTVTCMTGDAALRAGLVHAATALGRYSVMATPRKEALGEAGSTRGPVPACPEVFVVGRRPRRSVRLLVAMARECWVVSDTWMLDSIHARKWQPCENYVSPMFAGAPAARAAAAACKSLFDGLSIGWCGDLDVAYDEFQQMAEVAGELVTSFGAAVVVQGQGERIPARAAGPRAVFVNQRWLPDSIARWRVLAHDRFKPE